jgi:hypothetical protein
LKSRHYLNFFVLTVLFMVFCSLLLPGKDAKPQMYMVCEYQMSPTQAFAFDSDVKDVHVQLAKHGFPFNVNVFKTDDYHGYKVYKLKDFSDVDRMNAFWEALPKRMGQRNFDNLFGNLVSAQGPLQCSFWFQRDDLSYLPQKSSIHAVSQKKQSYVTYQFYYFEHGRKDKAEALFRQMVKLFTKKGIGTGFTVLEANVGAQRLTYILSFAAADSRQFQQMEKNRSQKLGVDGSKSLAKLNKSLRSLIRTYNLKRGSWYPELSFKPGRK